LSLQGSRAIVAFDLERDDPNLSDPCRKSDA
jgi:hypothetical protein